MSNANVIIDSFTDFTGKEHKFVIAALKVNLKDEGCPMIIQVTDKVDKIYGTIQAGLKIGIAICNPVDEFDQDLGITTAIARASNSNCVLYTTYKGQLSDALVETYLKEKANHLIHNPGKYIKGYDDAKTKFMKKESIKDLIRKMSDFEQMIVLQLQENPKYLDNVNTYMDYWNKCKNY